jgi:hypothetical protein
MGRRGAPGAGSGCTRCAGGGAGGGLDPTPNVGQPGAGSPREVPQPGHQGRRGGHRTPSAAPSGNRHCRAIVASSVSTSPPRAANRRGPTLALPPTSDPAGASSRATSTRGGAPPLPASAPPPGASTRIRARPQGPPIASYPAARARAAFSHLARRAALSCRCPEGAKPGRSVPGRPQG